MKMFPARLISKSRAGYRAAAVRDNIRKALADSKNPFVITGLANKLLGFELPGAGGAGAGSGAASGTATTTPGSGSGGATDSGKSDKPDGQPTTK